MQNALEPNSVEQAPLEKTMSLSVMNLEIDHFWVRRALRWCIILIIAIAFTSACVALSEKIGRLSSTPNYDDCTYMAAAEFLHFQWRQQGLSGVLTGLSGGMHSPFSQLLAATAFAIFGHSDRAPYQANVLVTIAYLGTLGWLLRGLPLLPWIASLVVFLSLPIAKMGVVEFRPDIFWAICTAFGAIYILTSPGEKQRESFFAGVIFAAAFLTKPTTFALTSVVLLASFGGRLFHAWVFRREQKVTFRGVLRSSAIGAGVLILLAGWYYARFGASVWDYFYRNTFGANQSVWSYKGSRMAAVFYYINGDGSLNTLGNLGQVILILTGILTGWMLFSAATVEKMRCILLVAICVLIYAINTLAAMKNEFVGAAMHMLAIFVAAYLLNCFYLRYRERYGALITSVLIICAVIIGIFFQTWPPYSNWSIRYPTLRYIIRNATNAVIGALQTAHPPPHAILFVQSGPVVPEAVQIAMLRRNQNLLIFNAFYSRTVSDFEFLEKQADAVVVPAPNTDGITPWLPVTNILSEIPKKLTSQFFLYETFQLPQAGAVYVYLRNPHSEKL